MIKVEEKVENLEILFAKFLHEMAVFKDEMKDFKDESLKERKRMNREWGNLARKMGTIVEDLIAPALVPVLKKYFKCDVNMEGQRIRKRIKGEEYEIDAIALCEGMVFMIEVRSTPKSEYVSEISDKARRFFEFFPEYRYKKLVVIFGGITFPENIINFASKKGIYIMAYREWEYMDILNFEDVKK